MQIAAFLCRGDIKRGVKSAIVPFDYDKFYIFSAQKEVLKIGLTFHHFAILKRVLTFAPINLKTLRHPCCGHPKKKNTILSSGPIKAALHNDSIQLSFRKIFGL